MEWRVIDMTIDEAIEDLKYDIEIDMYIRGIAPQLAEWLEELKVYQQHEIICNKGYNEGYNKAIDDFVKLVHKHDWNIRNINENSFIYGAIDTLAEQLKAGGENDNLRK